MLVCIFFKAAFCRYHHFISTKFKLLCWAVFPLRLSRDLGAQSHCLTWTQVPGPTTALNGSPTHWFCSSSAIKEERFWPATDRNILSVVFTWCRCQRWVINFSEQHSGLGAARSCLLLCPVRSLTTGWASHWGFVCFLIYAQQPFPGGCEYKSLYACKHGKNLNQDQREGKSWQLLPFWKETLHQ